MKITIRLLLLAALIALPQLTFAQSVGGTFQGHISSESGDLLSGATVTVKEINTGFTRSVKSDADGFYRITELRVGKYEMTVELQGFSTQVRSGLNMAIGQQLDVNFTLKISSVEEVVTVSEEAPIVERNKTAIGTTVTNKLIDDLPLTDRNFTDLALLSPGVTPGSTEGSASKLAGTGSTNASNTMYIDGVSNDQDTLGDFRGEFSPDAIGEFEVQSSQYAAEYGQATGAIINVLTRSGTNTLHARLSSYYRADGLAADNPFATEKTPFNQTIFSGYLSGPIVKDKTFFFASYEQTWRNDNAVIAIDPGLLAALGLSTDTTVPLPTREPRVLFRLDNNLNPNQTLNVKYQYDRKHRENVGVGDIGSGLIATSEMGYTDIITNQAAVVNHTWLSSGEKMNEARFQFARDDDNAREVNCPACAFIQRPTIWSGKYPNFPEQFTEDRYQFVDSYSFALPNKGGDHYFKAGFDYSHINVDVFAPQYADGNFVFVTDQPYNAADPSTHPQLYVQGTGDPNHKIVNNIYAFYFQDQWNLNRYFTLNLGLRYDYEDHIAVKNDKNNFGPRIHFSYDPFKDGKTAIRGGYGRYYDQVFLNVPLVDAVYSVLHLDLIYLPGYPDPSTGGTAIPYPPQIAITDPNGVTPNKDVFSFGFQRELQKDLAFSADVVFAKGHNQLILLDANYPVNGVRPDPNYSNIFDISTVGRSNYKSLQVAVLKRFSSKYSLNIAYTLASSKANTFGSQSSPTDQNNIDADYGPTADDFRHNLTAAFLFDGPWGMKFGIRNTWLSAPPYNITTGNDDNNDLVYNDRPPGVGMNSARGSALWTFNVRAGKTFTIQKSQIEAFIEAFNLFNRTNPTNYVGNLRSSQFGEPTGVYSGFDPRQVQLGVRVDF